MFSTFKENTPWCIASKDLNLKLSKIFTETKNYYSNRRKSGLIKGKGTLSISGNSDSSDGANFIDCIMKIAREEHHIKNLLIDQISVTTFSN